MAPPVPATSEPERQLRDAIRSYAHDPLGFVRFAFPWGRKGSALSWGTGPRAWQEAVLVEIGQRLQANTAMGDSEPVRIAVASGHGIGKSALMAWIKLWALATFEDSVSMITANTDQQLRTKTWPQVVKWFNLMNCRHWFSLTETAIVSRLPGHARIWRGDRVTWNAHNTEAFAGLHNLRKRIVLLFDEASTIADPIWDVAEGALTDEGTEIVWIVFGNPTQADGRFRACFGKYRERWSGRQIDSRSVPGINQAQIARWVQEHGEDSDFVRVRVRGEFPQVGSQQFIAPGVVEAARRRAVIVQPHEPLVMGVDVARHGDDRTAIVFRRGRDARTIAPIRMRVADLMQVAGRVAFEARTHQVDAIFVDMGMGAGVVDRLGQMGVPDVFGIEFGAAADGARGVDNFTGSHANRRAQMWDNLRTWLADAAIPDDAELADDLVGPQYGFNGRDQIQLERKQDMKKRGLASPDLADALALTFAWKVLPRAVAERRATSPGAGRVAVEYDPFVGI
ncbi:MAG: terminase [Alphaproteobacteria bacterium]|nr:terminase [Alphaproteobacteria bacterium]MCW5739075.1 terminase [Alphaproteobacteria bacterium]